MINVEMSDHEQGIVVFDGTGSPLVLIDTIPIADVTELLGDHPVVVRVLVARLRAWADLIEAASVGDGTGAAE